jgi:hypothetical protein
LEERRQKNMWEGNGGKEEEIREERKREGKEESKGRTGVWDGRRRNGGKGEDLRGIAKGE